MLSLSLFGQHRPERDDHFGALGPEQASLCVFNLINTGWLISGLDAISSDLLAMASSATVTAEEIEGLRARLQQDAAILGDLDGPFTTITRWKITAEREIHRAKSRLFSEADANVLARSRAQLSLMEMELSIISPAAGRMEETTKRIMRLANRVGDWLRTWESSDKVTGVEAARRQVQPLMAAEAEKWRGYAQMELASALKMRNFEIPVETPPGLRERFVEIMRYLPLMAGAPSVTPSVIHPLSGSIPEALAVELRTTAPGEVRLTLRADKAQLVELKAESPDGRSFCTAWRPDFLTDSRWQRNLRKQPEMALGEWRLDWEIATTNLVPGDRFVTQTGTVHIAASATAPKGIALEDAPRKPRILERYTSESAIPLNNRHHIFSYIGYPILGFPRDLVDSVFGVVDKVPYVSIPVNFVYAAPGQLVCKPWWDDEYTSFSEQSAGFISWNEWKTGGEWEYFENARTWYWPENDFGSFIMGIFYLPLGLPRDLVDVPFGWLDQIPYVSMPISYVYEPVTLVTKPWYADRYTDGEKKGRPRTPYRDQSKNVIGLTEWWDKSRWVFFENYKTTTFRSPNQDKQARLRAEYLEAAATYAKYMAEWYEKNAAIIDTFVIHLKSLSLGNAAE